MENIIQKKNKIKELKKQLSLLKKVLGKEGTPPYKNTNKLIEKVNNKIIKLNIEIKTMEKIVSEIRNRQWCGTYADEDIIEIITGEPRHRGFISGY